MNALPRNTPETHVEADVSHKITMNDASADEKEEEDEEDINGPSSHPMIGTDESLMSGFPNDIESSNFISPITSIGHNNPHSLAGLELEHAHASSHVHADMGPGDEKGVDAGEVDSVSNPNLEATQDLDPAHPSSSSINPNLTNTTDPSGSNHISSLEGLGETETHGDEGNHGHLGMDAVEAVDEGLGQPTMQGEIKVGEEGGGELSNLQVGTVEGVLDSLMKAQKGKTKMTKLTRRRKRGPQQPFSAQTYFRFDALNNICSENPESSPEEIILIVENKWQMLDEEKKKQYIEKANKDQERYQNELKLYLPKSQGGKMKRPKARKHPNAPKHPKSAYLYFVAEHRDKIKCENPKKGFTEIAQLLGKRWRLLSKEDAKVYHDKALIDKNRYKREKKDFRPPPPLHDAKEESNKRRRKHPLAPKHPLSAYLFFVATNRPRMNEKHPEKSFTEVARILGHQWKSLPSTERRIFEILAFADKKRYLLEKEKWIPPNHLKNQPVANGGEGLMVGQGEGAKRRKKEGRQLNVSMLHEWVYHDASKGVSVMGPVGMTNMAGGGGDPNMFMSAWGKQIIPGMNEQLSLHPQEISPYVAYPGPQPHPHLHTLNSQPQTQNTTAPNVAVPNVPSTAIGTLPGAEGAPTSSTPRIGMTSATNLRQQGGRAGCFINTRPRGKLIRYDPSREIPRWTSREVARFIGCVGLPNFQKSFLQNGIDGNRFLQLTHLDLQQMLGVEGIGDRKKILKAIKSLKSG